MYPFRWPIAIKVHMGGRLTVALPIDDRPDVFFPTVLVVQAVHYLAFLLHSQTKPTLSFRASRIVQHTTCSLGSVHARPHDSRGPLAMHAERHSADHDCKELYVIKGVKSPVTHHFCFLHVGPKYLAILGRDSRGR